MVQINEDWRVNADPQNVILERRVESKTGGPDRWTQEGYYPSLQAAVDGFADKGINSALVLPELWMVLKAVGDLKAAVKGLGAAK